MKNLDKLKNIGLIVSIIIILFLSICIFLLIFSTSVDNDYTKLGIEINDYDIEYCTVYIQDIFYEYKVYKIKNICVKDIKSQIENSTKWSKNKYYEYIMHNFYEIIEGEAIPIDRDGIYYYEDAYAIFDEKNSKLYYLKTYPFYHDDYNEVLGIKTNNYKTREIYSVRGGMQNDGTDYYTYKFTNEQGKEIVSDLDNSTKWSKNKLEDEKLDNFEYTKEVLSIENGYYYYGLVNRRTDAYYEENFTEEEATGYEIGVYDADNYILYFYWSSY